MGCKMVFQKKTECTGQVFSFTISCSSGSILTTFDRVVREKFGAYCPNMRQMVNGQVLSHLSLAIVLPILSPRFDRKIGDIQGCHLGRLEYYISTYISKLRFMNVELRMTLLLVVASTPSELHYKSLFKFICTNVTSQVELAKSHKCWIIPVEQQRAYIFVWDYFVWQSNVPPNTII